MPKRIIYLSFISLMFCTACSHARKIQGAWLDDEAGIQVVIEDNYLRMNDVVTMAEKEIIIARYEGDSLFWEENFQGGVQIDFMLFKLSGKNEATIQFNPQSELEGLKLSRLK